MIASIEGSGNSKDTSQTSEKAKAPVGGETDGERRGNEVEMKGKNTFAVPRNVKPLGYTTPKPIADETPKSNDEFRNMFLKK